MVRSCYSRSIGAFEQSALDLVLPFYTQVGEHVVLLEPILNVNTSI